MPARNAPASDIIMAQSRLSTAVDALDAVQSLCIEAATSQVARGSHNGLAMVDPDHMASLLGLILGEMRQAEAAWN